MWEKHNIFMSSASKMSGQPTHGKDQVKSKKSWVTAAQ